MSDDKKPRDKHVIVCIGLARVTSGKVRPMFRQVFEGNTTADDKIDERDLLWEGVKHAKPGNVYEAESDPGEWSGDKRSIYVLKGDRFKWLRLWPDPIQRAAWEAEAAHTQAIEAQEKLRKDSERSSELDELLAPLAMVYRKLPWHSRSAFLAEIGVRLHRLSNKAE